MNKLQDQLVKYKTLPVWNKGAIPRGFRNKHNTKEGTWAKLSILQGELKFYALNEDGEVQSSQVFSADHPAPFVEPQVWHRVEPLSDDLQCVLEFYCLPERYYEKKYQLTAPHSEVIDVLNYIDGGAALDLGCGRGRNSILLCQNGFNVTALDHSEESLAKLRAIIDAEEQCGDIRAALYDINTASLSEQYDLIISTVVLQFLQPDAIPAIINNMQAHTKAGGLNLIVAPISTQEQPCPIDWPFTLKQNELKDYYKAWRLCKYNEDLGTFHRLDENGEPYRCKFATLIAQK